MGVVEMVEEIEEMIGNCDVVEVGVEEILVTMVTDPLTVTTYLSSMTPMST